MALLKVEQGHFETAVLILHNFFVFYFGYRCLSLEQSLERSLQPQAPITGPLQYQASHIRPPIPSPPISNPPFQALYHVGPPTSGPHSHIKQAPHPRPTILSPDDQYEAPR